MTRREFAKCIGAVAGVAAIHGFSFANEGEKKMKCAVVYFSRSGNTRFAAETIRRIHANGNFGSVAYRG